MRQSVSILSAQAVNMAKPSTDNGFFQPSKKRFCEPSEMVFIS